MDTGSLHAIVIAINLLLEVSLYGNLHHLARLWLNERFVEVDSSLRTSIRQCLAVWPNTFRPDLSSLTLFLGSTEKCFSGRRDIDRIELLQKDPDSIDSRTICWWPGYDLASLHNNLAQTAVDVRRSNCIYAGVFPCEFNRGPIKDASASLSDFQRS